MWGPGQTQSWAGHAEGQPSGTARRDRRGAVRFPVLPLSRFLLRRNPWFLFLVAAFALVSGCSAGTKALGGMRLPQQAVVCDM